MESGRFFANGLAVANGFAELGGGGRGVGGGERGLRFCWSSAQSDCDMRLMGVVLGDVRALPMMISLDLLDLLDLSVLIDSKSVLVFSSCFMCMESRIHGVSVGPRRIFCLNHNKSIIPFRCSAVVRRSGGAF